MGNSSKLLLPPPALSGCVFAAIVRDTRGIELTAQDRLNFFPASPLVSVTYVAVGDIRLLPPGGSVDAAQTIQPQPRVFVVAPNEQPTVSWSEGPVLAISLGIYPDAWAQLQGNCDLPELLQRAFAACDDVEAGWVSFCSGLTPIWHDTRDTSAFQAGVRTPQIADWARALIAKAALSGTGRSIRSLERRLKRWSGLTQQTLAFYAAFENLHHHWVHAKDASLAELATAAGYADQSHMGRAVRRATGFSPARLNHLIQTEEAFWCYRLLSERF